MKLHHVGIAVRSLEEALPVFEKLLGSTAVHQEIVADQKARIAIFQVGESRIELLEATAPDSPIGRFVAKRGTGIHHLTVPDLAGSLRELEQSGIRVVDRVPRQGAENKQIAFLHPSSTAGVLIELIEEESGQG
jgi:methylmalonyl-CoA/ethylmalonyl-CoA epimerase